MEVSGASADYAREWLTALAAIGIVVQVKNKWQLICDPVDMPENQAKAEKLKALRAKKRRKVLDALAKAKTAIDAAENFILDKDI
jgi:hypothetical protein